MHLRYICGEVGAMSVLGALGSCPKRFGNDIVKAAGTWMGLRIIVELTIQNIQTQIEVVPFVSAFDDQNLQGNTQR